MKISTLLPQSDKWFVYESKMNVFSPLPLRLVTCFLNHALYENVEKKKKIHSIKQCTAPYEHRLRCTSHTVHTYHTVVPYVREARERGVTICNNNIPNSRITMSTATHSKGSWCISLPSSCCSLSVFSLDQVEGEGWLDKNAALRGWAFFTSHGCKLWGKPIFSN